MPGMIFRCQACNGKLKAPANLSGRSMRCPRCRAVVTVPAAPDEAEAPAVAEDLVRPKRKAKAATTAVEEETLADEDEADVRGRLTRLSFDWHKVRLGLSLLIVMAGISAATGVAGLFCGWLFGLAGAPWGLLRVLSIVAPVVTGVPIAAFAFFLYCPPRHAARPLALAALALMLTLFLADLGFKLWELLSSSDDLSKAAQQSVTLEQIVATLGGFTRWASVELAVVQLLHTAQQLIVAWFLVALARCLKNKERIHDAVIFFRWTCGLVAFNIIAPLLIQLWTLHIQSAIANKDFESAGTAIGGLEMFGWLVWLGALVGTAYSVWYLGLLMYLRWSVDDRLRLSRRSREAVSPGS
jgi:phage FluMu protein Com